MALLKKKECIEVFEEMIEEGFWITPDVRKLFYDNLYQL